MILLCLTCGEEIEADSPIPDYTFAVINAKCPRQEGEGVPPCDLLLTARPEPKEEP